jgi:hypothetical protein
LTFSDVFFPSAVFTLGIWHGLGADSQSGRFLHIGQDTLDPLEIGGVNKPGLSQISLPLGALLGEDMAGKGLAADNLAGARTLEPLGSPSVCFHLRHGFLPL